jgi:hypothetical protein
MPLAKRLSADLPRLALRRADDRLRVHATANTGCAVFLGLPYVRVGTPHGSAFDIVGKGIAQYGTMLTALNAAASLAGGHGL